MSYNEALASRLSTATSVRATVVGGFDPSSRHDSRALFAVSDQAAVRRIAADLSIDEESLAEQRAVMTPGDLQLNFLDGHVLLASPIYIYPSFLRWGDGGSDGRLKDGERLATLLVTHGWRLPRPEKGG
jgi:hypothetical protein